MANWKYELNLKDLWDKFDSDKLTSHQVGLQVSKRIKTLSCYKKYSELEEMANEFERVTNTGQFDTVLCRLYDWADSVKCWIVTF